MKYLILILLLLPNLVKSQAPGCPNINVNDTTVTCDAPCVDLIAEYLHTGETTSYDVQTIPYTPPYGFTGGTSAFVGIDDIFSNVITIPFDFCFYGNTYNQLVVGANGLISFDISLANTFCTFGYSASIPSTPTLTGPYENAIHGAFHDIDPSVAGDINYATLGTAPCRTFVVNFSNVAHFSCTNLLTTQQIVIYETTNAIEVYIENKPTCTTWNSGNALIGIQNIGATQGICPPNRNTGPWSATQEAWRFTPNGNANYSVEWFDNLGVSQGFGDTLNVCTQNQEDYTAEITYINCNGTTVTETVTSTVFVNGAGGQIASLGLPDTIKSCTNNVTIEASDNFDTYDWSTGENTSSITVNQSGNYILEATQSGCDGDDTVYVSIVNANILQNDTTICELDTINLTIEEINTNINWSTGESNSNIIIYPIEDTQYWVEINDGITSCTDSIQININNLPIVDISGTSNICKGDYASIVLNIQGQANYNLNLNQEILSYSENYIEFTINPEETIIYTIDYIADAYCTNDSNKTHQIIVNPIPQPNITPSFYEIYPNEEIILETNNIYTNYSWYNENDSLISQNKNIIADSTLSVYVIVESTEGCLGESEIAIVQYIPRVILYIPNTFTPNGDEHNEVFFITGEYVKNFYMNIIDRWGESIFSTNDINKHWDGRHQGRLVQQGSYTYNIQITGEDNRYFIKNGIINVIY